MLVRGENPPDVMLGCGEEQRLHAPEVLEHGSQGSSGPLCDGWRSGSGISLVHEVGSASFTGPRSMPTRDASILRLGRAHPGDGEVTRDLACA